MKLVSLLLSALLGVIVLAMFLHPWDWDLARGLKGGGPGKLGTEAVTASTPSKVPPVTPEPVPGAPPAASPQAKIAENGAADVKPRLLAHEQAEAERQAALHPIEPEPVAKRYFKVKVRDAGSLEIDGPETRTMLIRIDGINAREADGLCTKADGGNWPCGAQARAALTRFIRARAVTCTLPPGGESAEFGARCSVSGEDLAIWLVRQGWALPGESAEPALAEAMAKAKADGLGLWQTGGASP